MDQELLNLFNRAAAAQGGRSKVLSALQSPYIAFLADQYDPYSAMGGSTGGAAGGQLWSQYAGSQEPVIQDIMGKIAGGMDQYALSSYIDSVVAKNPDSVTASGFQVKDLKGLASALHKEYTGGGSTGTGGSKGGKQDTWGKMGMRNPSDTYSINDVPIDARTSAALASLVPGYQQITDKAQHAQGIAGTHRGEFNRINEQMAGLIPEYTALDNPAVVHDASGFATVPQFDEKKMAKWHELNKQKTAANEASRVSTATASALAMEQDKQAGIDAAMRQGVLRAYQEMGRTPAKDQMAGILRFLAGSHK